jgi:8-oxo-dGTP diphosphatase
MLHRVKKAQDMHAGKWNGLGGKFEAGESPEACAVREVLEESGLLIARPRLRGVITFPAFAHGEDWLAFVFVAHTFTGDLIDSAEGQLEWIADGELLDLNLWAGDRIFLPWLNEEAFFSGRFDYMEGALVGWEAFFYDAAGRVERRAAGGEAPMPLTEAEVAAADKPWIYTPAEDTYCWVCGGEVAKRQCKIICLECGFMRDCSDP